MAHRRDSPTSERAKNNPERHLEIGTLGINEANDPALTNMAFLPLKRLADSHRTA